MKRSFSKAAFLVAIALTVSATTFAQESKVKIEDNGYELKIKQDGNEYKRKEKGVSPMRRVTATEQHTTIVKQGETVTKVKAVEPAITQAPVTKKKSYASGKKCSCATKVAHRPIVKKHTVAYKPKTSSTAKTIASARVVHDTVFVTRVDTVFNMIETQGFAGYDRSHIGLRDDFTKLKIEREKNGEVQLKKEYRDGREEKRTFASEEEFNTYMEWKNF